MLIIIVYEYRYDIGILGFKQKWIDIRGMELSPVSLIDNSNILMPIYND